MTTRAAILASLIVFVGLFGTRLSGHEVVVARQSLANFPSQIGEWQSGGEEPLDDDVLQVLGVDEYVNRTYVDRAGLPLNLYIGYYASQRQGSTIHSPQNCLPGSGWQPVESSRIQLTAGGRTFPDTILVDQGLADKFLNDQLKPELLEEAARAAGQRLELRMHRGYDHGYFFIQTFIRDHVDWHARRLLA